MSIYGYCRISTAKQSIERQIRNIKESYPCAVIVQEVFTGTTSDRRGWKRLRSAVRPGDVIVFDSVSRMSRNAEEGFEEYKSFYDEGIELVFLKEPHINTAVYRSTLTEQISLTGNEIADEYIRATNNVLMILARQQIRLAFEQSEKEVEDLHRRTKEGIQTARLNGKQIGRPAGTTFETKKAVHCKEYIQKLSKDFCGTLDDTELIGMLKITRNTFYKYKRELREERSRE